MSGITVLVVIAIYLLGMAAGYYLAKLDYEEAENNSIPKTGQCKYCGGS